ncbi:hypothetical protein TNCV_4089681 [Trichonephila clavipes]|nr:hypothetical protein TNCV_4089681 [Trichonephila clavipes]
MIAIGDGPCNFELGSSDEDKTRNDTSHNKLSNLANVRTFSLNRFNIQQPLYMVFSDTRIRAHDSTETMQVSNLQPWSLSNQGH